jgi:L-threonylcarbamoyladenylate synthase
VKVVPPTPEGIAAAARAIRRGHVVLFPTETVYGLAVDPFSPEAIQALFEIKGRDPNNPVLLIVADEEQLNHVIAGMSPAAAAYARAFWPGPLSMLFPRAARVPDLLTAGRDKVCVRRTSSPIGRDLCLALGTALTASSANRSGHSPARAVSEVDLAGIAVAIDGGLLPPSPPSTVFDPDAGVVLREGAISERDLKAVMIPGHPGPGTA